MPRSRPLLGILLVATLLLGACSGERKPGVAQLGMSSPVAGASCTGSACTPGAGAESVSVFVEPDARATPVTQAIEHATRSVWVETYLLTDTTVISALESAANRGVDVRVLLELAPYGEGSVSPQVTLERLRAAGVKAQGADPRFQYTHAKMMVVDHTSALIMTCNLTLSGLGGSRSATAGFPNRDFGVIDTDSADVNEAAAIFQADWSRTTPTQSDPNLVISPVDSRAKLTALLDSAHTQLLLEDEELSDQQIENHLVAAARRGVNVEIVLPAPTGTSSSGGLSPLLTAGVHVRYSSTLYMHAKMILVDGHLGFVGSENFSATSLDNNREVGVLLSTQDVLATLASTFSQDWSSGSPA